MDYIYKYQTILLALDRFLEVNNVSKDAPYSDDVLVVDTCSGYREQLLRMVVPPHFVVVDDFIADTLAKYMVEV